MYERERERKINLIAHFYNTLNQSTANLERGNQWKRDRGRETETKTERQRKRERDRGRKKITHILTTNLELFREVISIKKKIMRKYASRNREKEMEREGNHERKREKSDNTSI